MADCKWFHGVRSESLKSYAQYGILPKNRLRTLGITPNSYGDSRPGITYVTSRFDVAHGFAVHNRDGLKGYNYKDPYKYVTITLCMGPIRINRKDRNGDHGAVEVLGHIRPEYLRVHNYQDVEGICWPLLWVAEENGWI